MAQFNQSAFGVIKGKVGNMVVSKWKDKHVAKRSPGKSSKRATASQQEQRKKMELTGRFMRHVKEVVTVCYRERSGSVPPFSAAMGDVLVNGITGTYPDYSIDYSQVLVSRGDIRQPFKPTVASAKIDTVTFTWTTISGLGKSRPDDKAVLVVYCEKLDVSAYTKERVESSGSYKLTRLTGKTKMKRILQLETEKLLKATTFVKALKPLLFVTYRFTCKKDSYYKCAIKHLLHWVSGTPPDMIIDYSKVLVACGNRFNTERAVAKPVDDTILFKWEDDLIPKEYATDKTILVAYCEVLNKCIFTTMGPPRTACKAKLEVAAFRGQAVHTWLSFISADSRQVADSIYTGKLIVAK